MAHILPETIPQSSPGEVIKTFRALKTLPDSYFIWHHLAPWEQNAPDFLIVTHDKRALLVKVSSAAAFQASNAAQLMLIDDNRPSLGTTEAAVLNAFIQRLNLPADLPLETLVVFPNIAHRQVLESRLERQKGEPAWAGKEILLSDSKVRWEDYLPSAPVDGMWLEKIRQGFTPEIVVPAEMSVRPIIQRRLYAGITDYLLDYNQESALKSDLHIEPEGQPLINDFRLNIINGVAGSGKTLILLFRLRLLYDHYPDKKFLVLTHNRPLIHDMQGRFARLTGRDLPENIEWKTFSAWCHHLLSEAKGKVEPMGMQKRKDIIKDIWQEILSETTITDFMLHKEIDWFKDQLPMNRVEYLNIDRRGRGFGLNPEQRNQMWAAMLAYQQRLAELNRSDWGDIPQRLWKYVEANEITLPQYDFVFIDEAQFFAPIWMRLVLKSIKAQNAHLFLVADPTQGFLGRGVSWKSLGLEARGRTHLLRRSHRTTHEIMQFASLFYRLRLPAEHDDEILAPDLLNMPNGAFPLIITLNSSQDEITRVVNEVAELVKNGVPRKHLLLLHVNGQGCESLIQLINHRLGNNVAINPKETYPGDYIRVTTLNAGAGIESPIVFLVGLRELFEEEQSLRLTDDERMAIIRDNTRKIYMAATRAGQRLIFTYVGVLPDTLAKAFKKP